MVREIRPDDIAIHEGDTERVGNVVMTGEGDFAFATIVVTESKYMRTVSRSVILSGCIFLLESLQTSINPEYASSNQIDG